MKNLKLLHACHTAVGEGDSFCVDPDENIYLGHCRGITLITKSNQLMLCAKFDSDEEQHHVIGMEYLVENGSIFIASSSGNLYLYDIAEKQVSNIGIVVNGIEQLAWSPDHEFLVLLTERKTFVLMTSEFDPITEKGLFDEEFGQSKPINVGWGSKTTQFHGSEGKGAALVKQKEPMSAVSYDDRRSRICWRNDAEYFVISSINEAKGFRQLRIWSKDGVLQYTGEVIEGIEEPVSWRLNGDLIVCSQQCPNKHKIIFVERNGLKHGEFALPFKPNTFRVTLLSWSNDSNVLAVGAKDLLDASSDFQVMLWTTGNYHWYLKQKFNIKNCPLYTNLVAKWSSKYSLEMHCYNQASGLFYSLKWIPQTIHSPPQYKCEDSLVVSIDNENILATPFDKLVVPPPLCGYKFTMTSPVQSVFFAPDRPAFGAYLGDFKLAVFLKDVPTGKENSAPSNDCKMQLVAAGGNGFKSQVQPYSFHSVYDIRGVLEDNTVFGLPYWSYSLNHWTWIKNNSLLCECYNQDHEKRSLYSILYMKLNFDTSTETKYIIAYNIIHLRKPLMAMCSNEQGSKVAVQYVDGEVQYIVIDEILNNFNEIKHSLLHPWKKSFGHNLFFNTPCPKMCIVNKATPNDEELIVGLSHKDFEFPGLPAKQFVTSYFVQRGFVFYTTTSHLLNIYQFDASKQNGKLFPETQQKIERNAKIVFVPPNSTKVILQMPRGNLETIHPRPLVLSAIFELIDKLEFLKAFELAKVHRIDLNVLYDYNPKKFLCNIKLFVEQLESKDLNLFLADLKSCNVCVDTYKLQCNFLEGDDCANLKESTFFDDKVNILCDKIRETLDPDNKKHFLPFLATYALRKPPCLDKALLKIKCLKDSSDSKNTQDTVNSALDFLLYLVNVNELIDVAFGTYDLETTIMVAQKSQKDPKEFLPFYNDLQKLDENYRKYKIDMHLNRYKKALDNISKCDGHFEECIQLIKEKKLFVDALYLFPFSSDQNKTIWTEYGNYLEGKGYHDEAGLVFSRIGADELAFKAYRDSSNWKESLNLAYKLGYSEQKILGTCQYLVERLKDKRKYLDAGYLLEHIIKDIEEAVVTLIEGCEWSNAILLMSKYQRFDIADTHLVPSLIMLHKTLIPELDLLLNDFNTHLSRLKYLRSPEKKKLDEETALASKYGDDDQFSEVTSVSDVSSSHSESTRMSGSIMTRKSSKSRRKQQLKKYRLKQGSPDEDLALIVALSETVRKVDGLKDNFLNNIRVLVQHGFDTQAKEIQMKMRLLVSQIDSEMTYIWSSNQNTESPSQWSFGPDSTANTIAASRKTEDKNAASAQLDPQLAAPPWRNIDIFLNMLQTDVNCK